MTPLQRQVADALKITGSALVGGPGGRWTIVGCTGLHLKDHNGQTLVVSSQTLKSWGWWPPWRAEALANGPGEDRRGDHGFKIHRLREQ